MRKEFQVWRLPCLSANLSFALMAAAFDFSVHRRDALYHGTEPLIGRIRGQEDVLPSETVRCANCHSARSASPLSAARAPHIDGVLLLEARQRRGGPPSQYNEQS